MLAIRYMLVAMVGIVPMVFHYASHDAAIAIGIITLMAYHICED